jgi:6-phosphogluconolactonase
VHPSGKFLYASTRGTNTISAFNIDPETGKLTPLEIVPSGGKIPRSINIDPSGRFLISANQNSDRVAVFRVDVESGRLTPTGQTLEVGRPVCVLFAPVP